MTPASPSSSGPNAVADPRVHDQLGCVLVDESGQPIPPGTVFDGLNGGVRAPLGQRTSCTAINEAVPLTLRQDGRERRRRHGDAGRLPAHGHAGRPAAAAGRARPRHGAGVGDRHRGAGAAGRCLRALGDRARRLRRDQPRLSGGRPDRPPPRQVVIGFGQAGICTFTNDDQPAHADAGQDGDQRQRRHRGADRLDAGGRRARRRSRESPEPGRSRPRPSTRAPTRCPSPAVPPGTRAGAWSCTGGHADRLVARPDPGRRRHLHDQQRRPAGAR